jgi:hypothetical protein
LLNKNTNGIGGYMVRVNNKTIRPLVAAVLIGLISSNITAGVTPNMIKHKLIRFFPVAALMSFFSTTMLVAHASLEKIKEKLHLAAKEQAHSLTAKSDADSAEKLEEKKRLKEIIALVGTFANRSKQRADEFFSTNNKESYSTHVGKFAADLRELDQQLIQRIKHMLNNAQAGSAYKEILDKIHAIIMKLYTNLNALQSTLNNGRSLGGPAALKALMLGKTLSSLEGTIAPTIDQLNAEISKLHSLASKYDPEIATAIEALQAEFRSALASPNRSAALNALKHRFSCGG